ncbi:MAG: efflux RND transporter periplasmic adaptor subunit [Chitinophagaceae bacterium]
MTSHFRNIVLVITTASILVACKSKNEKKPETENNAEKKEQAPPVATVSPEKGILSTSLQIPGELIAFQQVDIYAKVNSFVKKLYADVGSEVKQGQLLATMEAPEINSQLSGAESRLQSLEALYIASKANYERLLETSKTPGTISPNDLDIADAKQKSDYAQLLSAKASYKEITDNKNYLEIRAPFTGVISARNVSPGAYVGPSGKGSDMPLFVLQEQQHLRLAVSIPEAYTSYLTNKSKVDFTVRSLPSEKFSATISRRAGALDSRYRAERIEMDVINKDKRLLPGMVAEISLSLLGRDSTFIVPKTAVVNSSEKIFVIKVDNGKAKWVTVKKGREVNDKVEVYGDLSEKDILLKSASEEVRDDSQIKL